jgi:selenide,water dikinase
MTQLNSVGEQLGSQAAVHAMTDVTGFGLCGHLLEVCRGSCLGAVVIFDKVREAVILGWRQQSAGRVRMHKGFMAFKCAVACERGHNRVL